MLRQHLTKMVLGLAVSAGMIALGSGTAEAHLFHHGSCGSSGGSWGSSGGSWGSSGGSWGSSGGSWGSSGGSWGSSGGSWGSCGSCGSCGGYAVYYGSCGSSGGSYGGAIYSTPAAPMMEAPMAPGSGPTPPPIPAPPKSTYYNNVDAAYLVVSVPADAKVFVNDRPTSSVGAERQYVSHGLEQGMHYEYTVRAEIVRDGKTVVETKTVQLTAGNNSNLAFAFEAAPAQTAKVPSPVRTSVMLHVPTDAKVFLAGQEMKSTGADREFSTSKLAAGAQWDNYTVRVVSGADSQEKTITLSAGETRDLSFDFPAHVASN